VKEGKMQQASAEPDFKFLHAMIRVRDLDRSLGFYCDQLGMHLLRKTDYPDGKFTNAFIGYGAEDANTVVELTHNWDQPTPYELGTGFGHLALGVKDIHRTCESLRGKGVRVVREPGPMKHGKTVIAFIEDPDGYKVELIEIGTL
jgi:lactoylglutathione lyase